MFLTKLKLLAPLAFAVLGITAASIESALAAKTIVPGPIVGAGLPALAVVAGGYWVLRRVRGRR
jgi:hypothetical protein